MFCNENAGKGEINLAFIDMCERRKKDTNKKKREGKKERERKKEKNTKKGKKEKERKKEHKGGVKRSDSNKIAFRRGQI